MKVYLLIFDDGDNYCIEKVCQHEIDAITYCNKMNKQAPYNIYHYREFEVE